MYIAPHLWRFFEGPRTEKKKLDFENFLTLTFCFSFLSPQIFGMMGPSLGNL